MKKVIFVWVLVSLFQIIVASCNIFCKCSCGNGQEARMNILSWKIDTINNKYDHVDPSTPYPYKDVSKILSIGDRQIVKSVIENKGDLMSSAYACQPAPIEANQTFTAIQIISTIETSYAESNDLISMGQDITDRFLITDGYFSNFQPIESFIDGRVIYDSDQYLIRLGQEPGQNTTLTFDIIITLSDGSIFELEDQMISVM